MITVLVVDDHAVVRRGLAELLGSAAGIEVIGAANDGEHALGLCAEREPDVVLMDLSMPGLDGVETTRRLTAAHLLAQVVVLTSFADRDRILAALDAGAVGYLLKDSEPHEIVEGVRAAARGESPIDSRAGRVVLTARRSPQAAVNLTDREREVLGLIGEGLPNKLIARRLEVSEKTVKAHLTSVYRRIGVDDRTQAALWAQRHGLTQVTARPRQNRDQPG
jgi:DNA-binding NarL/FixJ family response regulator